MTANGITQLALYLIALIGLAVPLGAYMARVYLGQRFGLDRALGWLERLIYRLGGVDPLKEMSWRAYTAAILLFHVLGFAVVYALMRLQDVLPLNPEHLPACTPDLSFNTAASFTTNTNWQ